MIPILVVGKPDSSRDEEREAIINGESDMKIIARVNADYLGQGVSSSLMTRCQVTLIYSSLPNKGALEFVKRTRTQYPQVNTIIMDLPKSIPVIMPYIEAGAAGYVLQEDSAPDFLQKIRAVSQGQAIICPEVAAALIARLGELAILHRSFALNSHNLVELTSREREVLKLIGRDLSNHEIANRLYIQVGTVKRHVHNILRKLEVDSRYAAAAYLPILKSQENGRAYPPAYL